MRALALALAAVGMLAGCSPYVSGCNHLGWWSELEIHLDGPSDETGVYRVEVESDTELIACSQPSGVPDLEAGCVGEAELRTGPPPQALASIGVYTTPDVATVRVFLDDELLAEDNFEPEYFEDEPAGAGCGLRRTAEVRLDW